MTRLSSVIAAKCEVLPLRRYIERTSIEQDENPIVRTVAEKGIIQASVTKSIRTNVFLKIISCNSHGLLVSVDIKYAEILTIHVYNGVMIGFTYKLELWKTTFLRSIATPEREADILNIPTAVGSITSGILFILLAIG